MASMFAFSWRWIFSSRDSEAIFAFCSGVSFGSASARSLRLACQTKVEGDIEVETHPGYNWSGDYKK